MVRLQFKIMSSDEHYKELINEIAVHLFHARSAIELRPAEFNIDEGLNDIRAYWNSDNKVVEFICRYASNIDITTQRIKAYAIKSNLKLTSDL